uniref:Uncharacterized protein n=1 Tax=Solanum tuberosum TaxID=4113 RepID=M1DXH2_SOLTU
MGNSAKYISSRRHAEQVDVPHWDVVGTTQLDGELCKNWRTQSPFGDSPNRSASPTWTIVGTTKMNEGCVKLSGLKHHSADRRVVWQDHLLFRLSHEIKGFKDQMV